MDQLRCFLPAGPLTGHCQVGECSGAEPEGMKVEGYAEVDGLACQ